MEDIVEYKNKIKTTYSETSCSYNVGIVKGFLKYWFEEGVVKINPERIKVPRFRINPYHAVIDLEFHMFDDFLDTEPDNFANLQRRLIIRFLWETAVRVSELCEIEWADIDTSRNSLLIDTKKNEQKRWIFWSTITHQLLTKFIQQRRQYNGKTLFVTIEGPMTPKCIQRMLHSICKTLGITKHIVPHGFRHGRAHHIIKQGGSVVDVQHILGHKNPLSSHRYLNWNEQEVRERAEYFLEKN